MKIVKSKPLAIVAILLAIFALSVWVRLPNFNKPMGRSHEWITAHTLITLTIWKQEGIGKCHYSPIYTYPGSSNKKADFLGGVTDKEGNCYYLSYPPFAFIGPYLLFGFFDIPFSPASLQVFGLALHLICALLVFFLLNQFYRRSSWHELFLPSLMGYTAYLFATGNLWYCMNTYFCDQLEQVFFLAGFYTYLRIKERPAGFALYLAFALSCFLAVYTEWLGVLLCLVIGIREGLRCIQKKHSAKLFWIMVGTSTGALSLVLWQYISISGFHDLFEATRNKYLYRSGLGSVAESDLGYNFSNPASYFKLKSNFFVDYWAFFNLFCVLLVGIMALSIYRKRFCITTKELKFIGLLALPVLLHYGFFFNFNVVHDFGGIKTSVLLVVILAILADRFRVLLAELPNRIRLAGLSVLVILFVSKAAESVLIYKRDHNPVNSTALYEQLGSGMKRLSDQAAVFTNEKVCPELIYYAARNIRQASSQQAAVSMLNEIGLQEGFYCEIKEGKLVGITHFDSTGHSESVPL